MKSFLVLTISNKRRAELQVNDQPARRISLVPIPGCHMNLTDVSTTLVIIYMTELAAGTCNTHAKN